MLGSGCYLFATLARHLPELNAGRLFAVEQPLSRRVTQETSLLLSVPSYRNPKSFERAFVSALASGP